MRAREAGGCRPAASRATSCFGPSPSGAPTSRFVSATSESWLWRSGANFASARRRSTRSRARPSSMRRHPLIGERILLAAPALRPVARLVRSSHERWDGGGYPDALRGDEIPLGARVVAVCDAFDAMTTERPYRVAVSATEALEELRRCAGSQFDPLVVE